MADSLRESCGQGMVRAKSRSCVGERKDRRNSRIQCCPYNKGSPFLPSSPETGSRDPPKKENSPPKRHREPENEKPVRMPAKRKSELFNVPPKREAIVSSIPPPRQTSSFLPPPKRNAKMEDFTAGSATSTTRPPQRSALTPSVPPKRTFSEKPPTQKTEKTDRPVYTRDELWRMAREDPYYDETPTEDDGVYNRFAKMEFKTIFVVAALFVVCFVLLFTVVYVIMN